MTCETSVVHSLLLKCWGMCDSVRRQEVMMKRGSASLAWCKEPTTFQFMMRHESTLAEAKKM